MNTTIRSKFDSIGFDEAVWKKYHQQHQIEYIRIRLKCIKHFADGADFTTIADKLEIGQQAVRDTINTYLTGSYGAVVKPIERKQPTLLTAEQESAFRQILLTTHPTERGFEANIWTRKVMIDYLKKTYNVVYKSGIYDLLERLGLSKLNS